MLKNLILIAFATTITTTDDDGSRSSKGIVFDAAYYQFFQMQYYPSNWSRWSLGQATKAWGSHETRHYARLGTHSFSP